MDYQKLGFKAGIEIHNRLATKHKLFCKCPAKLTEEQPIKIVKRRLRAVAGELGHVDPAAMFEALRGRNFNYQVFDSTCLIELDDEPPRDMNMEALETVLTLCLLLKTKIPDEVHIMRKTVTDGSNTSAFQRTAIVGRDGILETTKGPVSITNVSIEEESAGIVEQKDDNVTYRLDRLGIPLVEIGTGPDLKDPEHVVETAKKIGLLIRSTGKSQRGIGTIRQDVNVSIAEGARIEIKGVQELDLIKTMVENEVIRQTKLLQLKKDLSSVKFGKIEDVTEIFRVTKSFVISKILNEGGKVYGLLLPKMNGLLKQEIMPGKSLGRELADYANAYGCKGLIHSDEHLDKYNLYNDFKELGIKLNKTADDAVLIIAGKGEASKAIEAVRKRLEMFKVKIPEETRVANPDGTTRYTRPLPGAGRMYPETDLKPISINASMLKQIVLPETWDKKIRRFRNIISADLADQITYSEYLNLFEKLSEKFEPVLVASILTSILKDLKRRNVQTDYLKDQDFYDVLDMVSKKKIGKEAVSEVLEDICKYHSSAQEVVKKMGIKSLNEDDLLKIVKKVINKNPELAKHKKVGPLMGDIMKEVRGRIDGENVKKMLEKELKI